MNIVEQHLDDTGILTITLNREDKLNALSTELLETLGTIFSDATHNTSVKGLLITGKGKAFCAGADIKRLQHCDAQAGYNFAKQGQSIFRQLEIMGKPSIAAVNGYAFGGGCELAMAATIRIASEIAQFGQPEVKLGVIPGYGGTQRLSRLIGKGRALDLCLSGRFIDADTALNYGLVTEVAKPEALLSRAKAYLTEIIHLAPLALESIMAVIDKGYDMALEDALHLEVVHFSKVCASKDKQEGVTAFLEKRQPHFIGE
jgi:enoyl-CoA hydratase